MISLFRFHGKDQDVVRFGHVDPLRLEDWNVGTRKKSPLLVRISIDRILDELAIHPAIIQQCVSLGRRPVADNSLACALRGSQELDQLLLRLHCALAEREIGAEVRKAGIHLASAQLDDARRYTDDVRCGSLRKDPQRSSMRRQLLHVEHGEAVRREDLLDCNEGEIGKVLVVYRVDLALMRKDASGAGIPS